jgi:hypothetical protein
MLEPTGVHPAIEEMINARQSFATPIMAIAAACNPPHMEPRIYDRSPAIHIWLLVTGKK